MVSSAYLRLLIFLLVILIPAWELARRPNKEKGAVINVLMLTSKAKDFWTSKERLKEPMMGEEEMCGEEENKIQAKKKGKIHSFTHSVSSY